MTTSAQVYNRDGDRTAQPAPLAFWDPVSQTTYMFEIDPADPKIPVSGTFVVTPSPIRYTRNGADQVVTQDTAVPANNRPLPVAIIAGDGGAPLSPLTDTELRATPVPVSVSGVATAANQATEIASLTSIDAKTPALVSGRQPVDGSGVTQPVSAAALPLPSGASTEAKQDTGNTSVASIDTKTPSLVSGRVPVDVGVSVLPTGAATETTLAGIRTRQDVVGNGSVATAQRVAAQLAVAGADVSNANPVPVSAVGTAAGRNVLARARNVYSVTNVTTGAYVPLIADTGATAINLAELFDSSGEQLVIAFGGIGSEVDQFFITPGGNGFVPILIPANTRVSVKAVSATASVGFLSITFYS